MKNFYEAIPKDDGESYLRKAYMSLVDSLSIRPIEVKDISTKVIDKYHRCTIDYEKSTVEKINEYRNQVVAAGYAKATDVRYEKGKEYIIIDPDGDYLHLVFHIKH